MATRHNAYIQVAPYREGWCLQGRIDVNSSVYKLYENNSLMSILLDITKEKYLKILIDGGATLGPWNDITYFPTEAAAQAMVPIIYNMIDFNFGDKLIDDQKI